jgi:seryl-tRNA synthetase
MSDKKKRTPQTAYSSTKEWESLQPKRDEVKAEINRNSVRKIDWNLLHNGKTAIKREIKEFNKQNKQGGKFAEERVTVLGPIAALALKENDGKHNFASITSFKY